MAPIRKTYAKQTVFHDGDDDLAPGITLHKLPGHAAGLQAVRVKTPRGPVLLASDAVHFFPNFTRAAPFPFTLDMPAVLASIRKVQAPVAGPAFLIPGHDPKLRAAYPALAVNGVTLSLLHEAPLTDPARSAGDDHGAIREAQPVCHGGPWMKKAGRGCVPLPASGVGGAPRATGEDQEAAGGVFFSIMPVRRKLRTISSR